MKWLTTMAALVLSVPVMATNITDTFYVYSDKGSVSNHWIPSGWMGDVKSIVFNDSDTEDPANGKTDIKIIYKVEGPQDKGWVGMYWQHPANNWGESNGGINLNGYKKLTFWARGQAGHEKIGEFKVGGIIGTYGDSASVSSGPVELTKNWKKYTIDLSGADLSSINGAFCWTASALDNPDGITFYLDEIRYEK